MAVSATTGILTHTEPIPTPPIITSPTGLRQSITTQAGCCSTQASPLALAIADIHNIGAILGIGAIPGIAAVLGIGAIAVIITTAAADIDLVVFSTKGPMMAAQAGRLHFQGSRHCMKTIFSFPHLTRASFNLILTSISENSSRLYSTDND
jgi:hypothetical protein